MSSACVFPEEILKRPRPLIFLCGLDQTKKTHRGIGESFSSYHKPNASLCSKLVDLNFEVPKPKQKKGSYEWYIPKGILKTSWIDKHLNNVPSVVAIFFELNWDEGDLLAKQAECVARVERIKQTLHGQTIGQPQSGHQTKIALVLIQKRTILPPGEDSPQASDYATQLCEACGIPLRSLLVLPLSEDTVIDGFIKRLHEELLALANAYYTAQVRTVRSHKDNLNKTTHALLFVRHYIKTAFFSEMQQSPNRAEAQTETVLKYYKQAYGNLTDGTVRIYDTNLMEVKTIAGFINYKICKLYFQNNQPLSAIKQFKQFLEYFKLKHGPQQLIFEHYAWLSKQFSIFAELFQEAVEIGLSAIQLQHPGFYYQQAAYLTMQRRESAAMVCGNLSAIPQNTVQADVDGSVLEFWGQRPWRPGIQSIEPPDQEKEKAGIEYLQQKELSVQYSPIITPLLFSAVIYFKKFNCARMKRWMMVQISEELCSGESNDHAKALKYLLKVLPEYRQEAWLVLFSSVLQMALHCAYVIADIEHFTSISIEVMGEYCTLPVDYKQTAQMNLMQLLAGAVPHPPNIEVSSLTNLSPDQVNATRNQWQRTIQNRGSTGYGHFTIDMNKLTSFISIKSTFEKDSFDADEPICLSVHIRSAAQFPVRFSKLSVKFSNPIYESHCVVLDSLEGSALTSPEDIGIDPTLEPSASMQQSGDVLNKGDRRADLTIKPEEVKQINFKFFPDRSDVSRKLDIASLCLQLGQSDKRHALLIWAGHQSQAEMNMSSEQSVKFQKFNFSTHSKLSNVNKKGVFSHLNVAPLKPSCIIRPRASQVSIKVNHKPPVLMQEWYKVEVSIENNELQPIVNTKLDLMFSDQKQNISPQINLDWPAQDDDTKIAHIHRDIPDKIAPEEKLTLVLFLRCFGEREETLVIKVAHDVNVNQPRKMLRTPHEREKIDNSGNEQIVLSCSCLKEERILLPVVNPYEMISRVATITMDPLETIHGEEMFLILSKINALSPWPVEIDHAVFELNPAIEKLQESDESLKQIILQPQESANIVCAAQTFPMQLPTTLKLGKLFLTWHREPTESLNLPLVTTTLDVSPLHNVDPMPISIKAELEPFGYVQQPMHVKYLIKNNSSVLQEMQVQVESTDDNMLFSGNKSLHCRLMPSGVKTINYTLIPIAVGFCKMPTVNITLVRSNKEMGKLVKQLTPNELFVKPSHCFLQNVQ